MENLKNFQIIIIGAGLSGLTLAREICSRSNYKILILEKKKKNYNMIKTGAFWSRPKNPFTNIYDNSWEKISIVINGEERIFKIQKLNIPISNQLPFTKN